MGKMGTVTIFIWWDSVMARQPRIDIPNTPYHVINRAVGRLQIFKTDKDYQRFIDILEEAKEKIGTQILAFTIMPDHWHLVLFPKHAGDMQKFMHLLTNAHTHKVHTITNTTGTIQIRMKVTMKAQKSPFEQRKFY